MIAGVWVGGCLTKMTATTNGHPTTLILMIGNFVTNDACKNPDNPSSMIEMSVSSFRGVYSGGTITQLLQMAYLHHSAEILLCLLIQ